MNDLKFNFNGTILETILVHLDSACVKIKMGKRRSRRRLIHSLVQHNYSKTEIPSVKPALFIIFKYIYQIT
jgi:hypothetical protein